MRAEDVRVFDGDAIDPGPTDRLSKYRAEEGGRCIVPGGETGRSKSSGCSLPKTLFRRLPLLEGRGMRLGVPGRSLVTTEEASEKAGDAARTDGPILEPSDIRDDALPVPIAEVRPDLLRAGVADGVEEFVVGGLREAFHRGRSPRDAAGGIGEMGRRLCLRDSRDGARLRGVCPTLADSAEVLRR